MSMTLNWDIAKGIVESLRRIDTWASHHLFTVKDWQAEVAAGDTHLGYHDWLECKIGNGLDDHELTFKDLEPPVLRLVATNPES